MLQIAELRAAVLLVYRDAQQAQVAELAPNPPRKFVLAVHLGRNRRQFLLRKPAHSLAHQRDRLAQLKVQSFHIVSDYAGKVQVRSQFDANSRQNSNDWPGAIRDLEGRKEPILHLAGEN